MKCTIFLSIVLFFATATGVAQTLEIDNYETITLKDGSIIKGYVKTQHVQTVKEKTGASKNNIELYVYSVQRMLPDSLVVIGEEKRMELEQAGDVWKKWFDEHEQYVTEDNEKKYVALNTVTIRSTASFSELTHSQRYVKVLETGAVVKLIDFPMQTISIKSADITNISNDIYSEEIETGILENIRMNGGIIHQGQVVANIPNKMICLYDADNKKRINIKFSDILERIKVGRNNNQTLFKQSPYCDVIETTSGETFRGLIVKIKYGKTFSMTISNDKIEREVAVNEIKRIMKEPNPEYEELKRIDMGKSEILLCEKELIYAETEELGGKIVVADNGKHMIFSAEGLNGIMSLQAKATVNTSDVSLLKVRGVQVEEILENRDWDKNIKKYIKNLTAEMANQISSTDSIKYHTAYIFSFEDIVKSSIASVEKEYPGEIKILDYKVQPGMYVLFFSKKEKVVLIEIRD